MFSFPFNFKSKTFVNNIKYLPYHEKLLVLGVETLNTHTRNLSLGLFFFFIITFIIYNSYFVGAEYKEILTFHFPIGNYSEASNSNIDLKTQSSFFLFLNKLNNKIPSWLKLLIKFCVFSLLKIKLLGINILNVFILSFYYIKIYCFIAVVLFIFEQ